MADKALAGKVAIITGSGKNIGKAIAETLARDGAAVVVNGRGDRNIIEETAKEIRAAGGRALPFLADVSKPDAVAAMVDAAVKEFGGVDIAVGNAGLRRQTPFLQMNLEEWHEILAVALDGAFIESLMKPMTETGEFASWIAPPKVGIDNRPGDFEYVKIAA